MWRREVGRSVTDVSKERNSVQAEKKDCLTAERQEPPFRQQRHVTEVHHQQVISVHTAYRERFFIYLINKYISLSYICLTVHH